MNKPNVVFTDEYIALCNGNVELVYWDIEEWKEDPEVVFSIVNAVKTLYEEGPLKVIEIVDKSLHNESLYDHCDKCGSVLYKDDIDGGRCLKCGSMILPK